MVESAKPTADHADSQPTHDPAGNLTYDGVHSFTYDAWNRLVKVTKAYRDPSSGNVTLGSVVNEIEHDGLGRRIVKQVKNSADLDCTYKYYHDGQRVIEERNGSDQVIRQHVWGALYIDELVQTGLNDDPTEDDTVDTFYFAVHDAMFNVIGLVDVSGVLVERYDYTPYGQRTVYTSAGTNDPDCHSPVLISRRWQVGGVDQPYGLCEIGFQGLKHDEETGLIHNRARVLHPRIGRFLQRDPLGYPDGLNGYAAYHVMHGGVDPSGYSGWSYLGLDPSSGAYHHLHGPPDQKVTTSSSRISKANYRTVIKNASKYGIPTGAIEQLSTEKAPTRFAVGSGSRFSHSYLTEYIEHPSDYYSNSPPETFMQRVIQGSKNGLFIDELGWNKLGAVFNEFAHLFWLRHLENDCECKWLYDIFKREATMYYADNLTAVNEAVSSTWNNVADRMVAQHQLHDRISKGELSPISTVQAFDSSNIIRREFMLADITPGHSFDLAYRNKPLSVTAFAAAVYMLQHGCDAPNTDQIGAVLHVLNNQFAFPIGEQQERIIVPKRGG